MTCCWILLAASSAGFRASAAEFYAYYTRVDSDRPFEKSSRTGDDADIIVKLGAPEGRLVFWRGTSYLPCWETTRGRWPLEEIVPRRGDGTPEMPDRVNLFSHAEIIEATDSKVIVHWRYLSHFTAGNPRGELDPCNFVEELFTVTPGGRITREVKQGTKTSDEWNDPLNRITQVVQLTADGMTQVSRQAASRSAPLPRVVGSPAKGPAVGSPCAWFQFDEGAGDTTQERVSKTNLAVPGHKTLWKQGVSGTALQFDGYHTAVALPAAQAPETDGGGLTLEGWIALGAYPWNWAPIVQQGEDTGYFLGVDAHGYPGFMIRAGGKWHKLTAAGQPPYTDPNHLALSRWYHLAGTYDSANGMMRLFVDGREVASLSAAPGGVQAAKADVRIGKASVLRVPTEGTHDTHPSEFGLDGLIDEVRIHPAALTAKQVAESWRTFAPDPQQALHPDLQARAFPKPASSGQFQAAYTRLPYYETWDNLWRFGPFSDVVVQFDQSPVKFVFWHGVSYVPVIVNESNQWFCNEFCECGFRPAAPGDNEPMSDKGCWNTHVRIIENTPARAVVHWRCWLSNPDHHWAYHDETTGWGDISDWHYYIYPDGVAVKQMRCYTSAPDAWHEWNEQMLVMGEGQHPEDVLEKSPVMTLVDDKGRATDYDWNPDPPAPRYPGTILQKLYYTGRYDPFTVQRFTGGDVYKGERTGYSVFPSWNHWPTSQINSSGRNASFPDRAAHSSVSHLFWPLSSRREGDAPYLEKTLMEGMTDRSATSLVSLARSWLDAPPIEAVSDCRSPRYDPSQRAYILCAAGPAPAFRIVASAQRPIENLCFVVKNWNCDAPAQLQIASQPVPAGTAFRQGIVRDPNGRQTLVAWLQRQGTEPVTITLRGAAPNLSAPAAAPLTWAQAPQAVSNTFDVAMAATPFAGATMEYLFERVGNDSAASGWQSSPAYTDRELPPDTEVAYRFKACDAYGAETDWSPVARVRTPLPPSPVLWPLDEGAGKTFKDSNGRHGGAIHGDATWVPGVAGSAMRLDGRSYVQLEAADDLHSNGSFTWMAWIRTTQGGAILARCGAGREWTRGGKVMFVEDGRLRFDAGWVGATAASTPVADGQWHHVAVVVSATAGGDNVRCFVDGRESGRGRLNVAEHSEAGLPIRIGFCNDDFPSKHPGFVGDLDEVRWIGCALGGSDIEKMARRP